MDPLEGIQVDVDTTFAFMLAAQSHDFEVVYVPPTAITLEDDRVFLHGQHVTVKPEQGDHFSVQKSVRIAAADCAAIFIRTDPPFDQAYLTTTWLLSLAEHQGTRIINSPAGLREANEHLFALQFASLCPKTLVSAKRQEILDYVSTIGGMAIAKPIDGHGGYGVVRLQEGDTNMKALIDLLTLEGRLPIMVQEFVDDPAGDKRLIVVDGKLRGAVRRVAMADDHRGNVHVGGTVVACELDANDHAIEAALGPRLRDLGLYFVGIDVLGGKLIEVNVTSPTLIQELHRLGGPHVADEIIASIEA